MLLVLGADINISFPELLILPAYELSLFSLRFFNCTTSQIAVNGIRVETIVDGPGVVSQWLASWAPNLWTRVQALVQPC